MGHRDMRLSGVFKRRAQGVELYMLDEGCLGWLERVASGVFLSDLWWSWHFLNVNKVLSSMYEVLVKLPGALGVCCRCWLLHLGGS